MEGFDKNPIIIKGYEDREVVIEAVKEMIEELDGRFMEQRGFYMRTDSQNPFMQRDFLQEK